MNTKPDNIPALPEDAVYLGKGGTFGVPHGGFVGWYIPAFKPVGWVAQYGEPIYGAVDPVHYAAPADSEVARLNGFEAVKPCPSENPCAMPDIDAERIQIRDAHVDALKAQLSEAVKLGDALALSASSVCCVNGPDDYRLSVKRLAAWGAFKASVGGAK